MRYFLRLAPVLLGLTLLYQCSDNGTRPDHAPVMSPVGPQSVEEGQSLSFTITAADPDHATLGMSATGLPNHSSFVDNKNGTGFFAFNPDTSQAGQYQVIFIASDGELADSETITITVTEAGLPVNHAPILAEIGPQTVRVSDTLKLVVTASDQDSTIPLIFAVNLPRHSSFASAGNGSGEFMFAPDLYQIRMYSILFYASDGELADSETIVVEVQAAGGPTNHPPLLSEIGPQTVRAGDTLRFSVFASDQDGTIPSLFAENLPNHSDFLSAGDGSGFFEFAPDTSQIGIHSVLFYASDGELADSETIMITVAEAVLPVNHPPVLAEIGSQSVKVGDTLRFAVFGNDQDGTIPMLFAENLPNHSSFVSSGSGIGLFTFAPDTSQSGWYFVLFYTSDGEFADSETVSIWVEGAHAPYLRPIAPQPCVTTIELRLVVVAFDEDGTRPALAAYNLPLNSSFIDSGGGIGELSFTPDPTQLGVFEPRIVASDGEKADTETVKITVSPYEPSDIWPMTIGNYWVYRVHINWHSGSPGYDRSSAYPAGAYFDTVFTATMNVLSSYQRDGAVHWLLGGGLQFARYDVSFRNDSIVGTSRSVPIPSIWPDRVDSVPAGIFSPTYNYFVQGGPLSWMEVCSFVFAKNVGIIKYGWHNGRPMNFESYEAVLIRYQIKQ